MTIRPQRLTVMVEIAPEVIEEMVYQRLLPTRSRRDGAAIAAAIRMLVEEALDIAERDKVQRAHVDHCRLARFESGLPPERALHRILERVK